MTFLGTKRPVSPVMSQQYRSANSAVERERRTSYKGKEKEHAEDYTEPPSPSLYTFIPRPTSAGGVSAPTSPSSRRSSILSTASTSSSLSRSSALFQEYSPFKFGKKKKPPPRQNPNFRMNLILPDVLEISAANMASMEAAGDECSTVDVDEEARERVRLREEAAQALGLASSTIGHQGHTDDYSESVHSVASNGTLREREENGSESARTSESQAPNNHRSALTSTTSLHPPLSPTLAHGRNRSGSMPAAFPFHPSELPPSLPQSLQPALPQIAPVPSFPSTWRALAPYVQTASSGTLPKYYPSSSLRIFAMSKQWKARHLILTTPTIENSNSNSLPFPGVHVSYLHLFKSASPDERELERLEINEDSVIFVSEEEIGGKKGVVQVAGVDVGFVRDEHARKRDTAKDVKGKEQAMWLFYIVDPLEKQRWIESIKNKVFGQRCVLFGPAYSRVYLLCFKNDSCRPWLVASLLWK
ncbi:hypothetical protein BT96DRAFT_170366 [Gymnopus androsaceus JB14]|uniref:PH domain-containing protein n=1 Tax=Gymnopus androsaceus JB14 TaxID=1447944 RepID=A0A6A4H9G7_9AGAR|nr:hypothetical protein BT96DRAFT_170366 [Gymnopus androsaceus JB14]